MTDAVNLLRDAQYCLLNVSSASLDGKKSAREARSLAERIIREYPDAPEVAAAKSILAQLEDRDPALVDQGKISRTTSDAPPHQNYPETRDVSDTYEQAGDEQNSSGTSKGFTSTATPDIPESETQGAETHEREENTTDAPAWIGAYKYYLIAATIFLAYCTFQQITYGPLLLEILHLGLVVFALYSLRYLPQYWVRLLHIAINGITASFLVIVAPGFENFIPYSVFSFLNFFAITPALYLAQFNTQLMLVTGVLSAVWLAHWIRLKLPDSAESRDKSWVVTGPSVTLMLSIFGGKFALVLLGVVVMLAGKGCIDMGGGAPGWIGEPLGLLFLVLPGGIIFLKGLIGWLIQPGHRKVKFVVLAVMAAVLAGTFLQY